MVRKATARAGVSAYPVIKMKIEAVVHPEDGKNLNLIVVENEAQRTSVCKTISSKEKGDSGVSIREKRFSYQK